MNQKKCEIKNQLKTLKNENEFLVENVRTVTDAIVRLNSNVVFCCDCKGINTCKEGAHHELERLSIPDLVSITMPARIEDYNTQIRKTNELLGVYDLPNITLKKDSSCP